MAVMQVRGACGGKHGVRLGEQAHDGRRAVRAGVSTKRQRGWAAGWLVVICTLEPVPTPTSLRWASDLMT